MRKSTAAISALLFLLINTAAWAGDVATTKKIVFVNDGKHELKGDIYRPTGAGPFPAVVLVHGGGFIMGSRDMQKLPDVATQIAGNGYVVFSIDYRLLNQGGAYPYSIADVNCAVRWIKAHAADYHADATRVGLIGASAGGYLALMAGYASDGKYARADCPAKNTDGSVSAVVDYYGIADLPTFNNKSTEKLLKMLLNKTPAQAPELYREASPVTYVKTAPPTLILHGTSDSLVDYSQSVLLQKKLKEAGRTVQFESFKDADHGFIHDITGPAGGPALKFAIAFLDKYVKTAEIEIAASIAKIAKLEHKIILHHVQNPDRINMRRTAL